MLASPPARLVNIESARTAAPGETVVNARGAVYSAIFDPGLALGSAGVRRGVQENVEVNADVTWAYALYNEHPNIDRNIFAARVGGKMANRGGWASVTAGVGGGFAPAAGGFTALDAGGIVSYPNCYAIPFGNGIVFGSVPLGAKQVDFRNEDGSLAASDRAKLTYGYGVGLGLEVPLDHARCRQGLTPARLQIGLGAATMIRSDRVMVTNSDGTVSQHDRYGALGLAVGAEFPF